MIGCDSQCGNNEGKIGLYKAIATGCVQVDKFVSNGPCDKTVVVRFCLLEVWSADTSNSTVLHVDVNCKGSDVGWTETLCLCSKSVFCSWIAINQCYTKVE